LAAEEAEVEEQEQQKEDNDVDEDERVREISVGEHVSALAEVFGPAWAMEVRRAIRS
jgi:hypothetical protein